MTLSFAKWPRWLCCAVGTLTACYLYVVEPGFHRAGPYLLAGVGGAVLLLSILIVLTGFAGWRQYWNGAGFAAGRFLVCIPTNALVPALFAVLVSGCSSMFATSSQSNLWWFSVSVAYAASAMPFLLLMMRRRSPRVECLGFNYRFIIESDHCTVHVGRGRGTRNELVNGLFVALGEAAKMLPANHKIRVCSPWFSIIRPTQYREIESRLRRQFPQGRITEVEGHLGLLERVPAQCAGAFFSLLVNFFGRKYAPKGYLTQFGRKFPCGPIPSKGFEIAL